jgi:hypothetical protein
MIVQAATRNSRGIGSAFPPTRAGATAHCESMMRLLTTKETEMKTISLCLACFSLVAPLPLCAQQAPGNSPLMLVVPACPPSTRGEQPAPAICAQGAPGQASGPGGTEHARATDIYALILKLSRQMKKEFIYDAPFIRAVDNGFLGDSTAGADADYDTLLAILATGNFTAYETADQVVIAPEGQARTLASRLLQEDDRRVPDNAYVTRVIDVGSGPDDENGVKAAQFVPILRPMMSQQAQLGAIQGTNKLVLVDRYDNVRRMTAVIRQILK